jgi:hypothetical protein
MGRSDRGGRGGRTDPGARVGRLGLRETGRASSRRTIGGGGWVAREHALPPGPCNIRGCGARTSHLTFPKS